jgi:hypothetical protein
MPVTNVWPWVPAGLDAKSDRAGWLPAVSYCSALLCQFSSGQLRMNNSGRRKRKSKQGDSHGKLVLEELKVGLRRFNV